MGEDQVDSDASQESDSDLSTAVSTTSAQSSGQGIIPLRALLGPQDCVADCTVICNNGNSPTPTSDTNLPQRAPAATLTGAPSLQRGVQTCGKKGKKVLPAKSFAFGKQDGKAWNTMFDHF